MFPVINSDKYIFTLKYCKEIELRVVACKNQSGLVSVHITVQASCAKTLHSCPFKL